MTDKTLLIYCNYLYFILKFENEKSALTGNVLSAGLWPLE